MLSFQFDRARAKNCCFIHFIILPPGQLVNIFAASQRYNWRLCIIFTCICTAFRRYDDVKLQFSSGKFSYTPIDRETYQDPICLNQRKRRRAFRHAFIFGYYISSVSLIFLTINPIGIFVCFDLTKQKDYGIMARGKNRSLFIGISQLQKWLRQAHNFGLFD